MLLTRPGRHLRWTSDEVPLDLVAPETLAKVREEKERAIEAGEFELAATLRDRERRLVAAVHSLHAESSVEPELEAMLSHMRIAGFREPTRPPVVLIAGLAAVAFAIGVLVAVLI
jgi:hypothetical protein